jgi:two-component system, OmpR family, sensor kinase
VVDQGPGLEPADAERIFEPFYRAEPDRARRGAERQAGTGLGLSIVAAIASSHGGSAQVLTSRGHGAAFVVRLPADVA